MIDRRYKKIAFKPKLCPTCEHYCTNTISCIRDGKIIPISKVKIAKTCGYFKVKEGSTCSAARENE